MVIYLQQEGRGIGLANKIAAYALQEQGLDTVDANRALGLPDDAREYSSVRNILRDLGVRSVRLMTNNPRKLDVLTSLGVTISGRVPCQVQAQEHSAGYLAAKRDRMSHLLEDNLASGSGSDEDDDAQSKQQRRQQRLEQRQQQQAEAVAEEEQVLDGSFCYWNHDGEPTQPSASAYVQGGMGLPPGLQEARARSTSPTLASHTVMMDEDDDEDDEDSSSGSGRQQQQGQPGGQPLPRSNGSVSSSSSSSTVVGDVA